MRERAAQSRRNHREHPRRRATYFHLVANTAAVLGTDLRSALAGRRTKFQSKHAVGDTDLVLLTGSLVASFLISRANASGLLYLSGVTCLSCNAGVGETVHNARDSPTKTVPRPCRETQH